MRTLRHDGVTVRAPIDIWGRWSVSVRDGRRTRTNAAIVVCGLDRRIKILWKRDGGELQERFERAVDAALAVLSRRTAMARKALGDCLERPITKRRPLRV